jgi:solute carrier family 25 (mitochondrial phosphate transporter), member 23/24/25/41
MTSSSSSGYSENSRNMMAGGVAGVVGKTVTAPLSRLTILYQLTPLLRHTDVGGMVGGTLPSKVAEGGAFRSLWREAKHVVRTEGFLAFWKGNFTSVLHRFPYSAINFGCFESAKRVMSRAGYEENGATRLLCGAYAGGVACAAAYPLDLIRTRLAIQADAPTLSSASPTRFGTIKRYSKIVTVMSNILAKEGPRGLYRGLLVSMGVSVPNLAIGFSVYGTAKEYFLFHEETGYFRTNLTNSAGASLSADNQTLNFLGAMSSGASGGIISSMLIFPMDIMRRRMQVVGILSNQTTGSSTAVNMLKDIMKTEGIRGLYRGILPELLKVIPMVSVTFSMYEFTKKLIPINEYK